MKPSEKISNILNQSIKLKIKWAKISYREKHDITYPPIIKTYKLKRFYSKKDLNELFNILDTKDFIFGVIKLNKGYWIDLFEFDYEEVVGLQVFLRRKPKYFIFNPQKRYDDLFDGNKDFKNEDDFMYFSY